MSGAKKHSIFLFSSNVGSYIISIGIESFFLKNSDYFLTVRIH